jgi:hypothetical protein
VFGAFAISDFVPMATGDPPALPPVVHLHGLFYFAWALLDVQSLLVNTGNVALVVFITLFVMAIRNVRDLQAHRRHMRLATLPLMISALSRVFAAFGMGIRSFAEYVPKYLLADAFIVAMLVHDRFVLGSLHRATAIGGALNAIPQLLHAPLVGSGAWVAFKHRLAGLGYYGAWMLSKANAFAPSYR